MLALTNYFKVDNKVNYDEKIFFAILSNQPMAPSF